METLNRRLANAFKALLTLERLTGLPQPTDVERDAAIQRFEYTFEMTWKAAQAYLSEYEYIQAASPRAVIRACFQAKLFDETIANALFSIASDRNLTVHTYQETFAIQLYNRLATHAALMRQWLTAMQTQIQA
ncbi:MAG: HI0074 family nucleotidyltransferase substrate-binding subunit [Anaerolineales bacterium]